MLTSDRKAGVQPDIKSSIRSMQDIRYLDQHQGRISAQFDFQKTLKCIDPLYIVIYYVETSLTYSTDRQNKRI